MKSLTCTIGSTRGTEHVKRKFNKRIFSYNWFIENDCHDLQLKCPIKIDVIVMISSRLSRPVAWSPWPYTGRLHRSKLLYLFISINKNLISFTLVLMVFFKAIILYCMSLLLIWEKNQFQMKILINFFKRSPPSHFPLYYLKIRK